MYECPRTPKQSQSCLICFNYQHKMPSVWDVIGQRCPRSSVNTAVNSCLMVALTVSELLSFPFFLDCFSALAFWIFLIFHLFNKLLWSWNREVRSNNFERRYVTFFAKRISVTVERRVGFYVALLGCSAIVFPPSFPETVARWIEAERCMCLRGNRGETWLRDWFWSVSSVM